LFAGKPYFRVAGPNGRGCENEGAYPALNLKNGSVYVGWEFNWATNIFSFACVTGKTKTRDFITNTPRHCLTLSNVAACARPARRSGVRVISLDSAFVPGYNRFPLSDFPRLAVSNRSRTVSMVWNDTRAHPNGDVYMQSFRLGSLTKVHRRPTRLDRAHGGGLTMFPALRVSNRNGRLDVAWYSRASGGTSLTSVKAAIGVSPLATATPRNITITNKSSNWLQNNSDIVPNFGDYIDAVVSTTGRWPFVGRTLYIAWADGRIGDPQPFEARMRAG